VQWRRFDSKSDSCWQLKWHDDSFLRHVCCVCKVLLRHRLCEAQLKSVPETLVLLLQPSLLLLQPSLLLLLLRQLLLLLHHAQPPPTICVRLQLLSVPALGSFRP
jgi:hypothetical protein